MKTIQEIKIQDYNYNLPDERIAKFPLEQRDSSKLLIYNGKTISETVFYNLSDCVDSDSLMVFNNTKVIQARLLFHKSTGATIEIFCLEPHNPVDYALAFQAKKSCEWICLVGNLRRWKSGVLQMSLGSTTLCAERLQTHGESSLIRFTWEDESKTFADILDEVGILPIPPYLNRETEESDLTTYQTVYSKIKGSVAAPTAGLHFTERVLNLLKDKGVNLAEVTLHVGAGTFRPVKTELVSEHEMHAELITVNRSTIETLLSKLGKIIAVGTTTVRTLESLYYIGKILHKNAQLTVEDLRVTQWMPYDEDPDISSVESLKTILEYMQQNGMEKISFWTQIIIVPGYKFHIIESIITNFHQPQSTLLLLISALVGEDWKKIYDYAMTHEFRFLSYGDSSFLKKKL